MDSQADELRLRRLQSLDKTVSSISTLSFSILVTFGHESIMHRHRHSYAFTPPFVIILQLLWPPTMVRDPFASPVCTKPAQIVAERPDPSMSPHQWI